MSPSQIEEYLIRLENEIKEFKLELAKISWFMRGGVTMQELLHFYSQDDRSAMYEVIKENIDITKQAQMPLL